jgi:hypothetical protein
VAQIRGEEVGSCGGGVRRGRGALLWVPRAGEAGSPVAGSVDRVGTIDAPVLKSERRGRRSLMEGKGQATARLRLLHGARGGWWSDVRCGSAWRRWQCSAWCGRRRKKGQMGWASRRPRPREERTSWAGSKDFRPNLEKEGISIQNQF